MCLAYSGNAIAGWKWEQVFSDNTLTPDIIDGYYDLKFKVYTQLTGAAEVTSNLSTVVNSTVNGSFQPFKVGGYLQVTYYTVSRRTCVNAAYSIEDLAFNTILNL